MDMLNVNVNYRIKEIVGLLRKVALLLGLHLDAFLFCTCA